MDECCQKRATSRLATRSASSKAPTVSFSEKTKNTRTCINGKEMVRRSSSRAADPIGNSKKTIFENRKNPTSRSEAPENGSMGDEKDGSDPVPPGKIRRGLNAPSSRSNSGSFGGASSSSSAAGAGPNRYGMRNLKCNSISDLVQSGCASNRNHNGTRVTAKKTNSNGEISSKSRNESLPNGRNTSSGGHGLSISDPRRSKSSVNANTRTKPAMEPSQKPSARSMNQRNVSVHGNGPSSSSTESTSRRPFPSRRVRNRHGNGDGPTGAVELGSTLSLENLQHYNIDGVAEVLLALERIEQDEELTYEQLLLLESRLILNGIAFYDEHRDMRLDIDDMSYEELLALEERIGNVSTALTEEAISRCLTRSIFDSNDYGLRCCNGDKNDGKCCICQDEYVDGDEIGGLECKHWFHGGCVEQWLRQKNWCPICKASAEIPGRPCPPS